MGDVIRYFKIIFGKCILYWRTEGRNVPCSRHVQRSGRDGEIFRKLNILKVSAVSTQPGSGALSAVLFLTLNLVLAQVGEVINTLCGYQTLDKAVRAA